MSSISCSAAKSCNHREESNRGLDLGIDATARVREAGFTRRRHLTTKRGRTTRSGRFRARDSHSRMNGGSAHDKQYCVGHILFSVSLYSRHLNELTTIHALD